LDLSQPIASLLSDFNDGTASGPRTRDNPRISGHCFGPKIYLSEKWQAWMAGAPPSLLRFQQRRQYSSTA